jgi:uncharacterized protein YkuJ
MKKLFVIVTILLGIASCESESASTRFTQNGNVLFTLPYSFEDNEIWISIYIKGEKENYYGIRESNQVVLQERYKEPNPMPAFTTFSTRDENIGICVSAVNLPLKSGDKIQFLDKTFTLDANDPKESLFFGTIYCLDED